MFSDGRVFVTDEHGHEYIKDIKHYEYLWHILSTSYIPVQATVSQSSNFIG
jgi:hypothetical protein